jgi:hypothetical protein
VVQVTRDCTLSTTLEVTPCSPASRILSRRCEEETQTGVVRVRVDIPLLEEVDNVLMGTGTVLRIPLRSPC